MTRKMYKSSHSSAVWLTKSKLLQLKAMHKTIADTDQLTYMQAL